MKRFLFVLAICSPIVLLAQADSSTAYDLDPVTVTATRAAAVRSIVSPSISIIPQQIIEQNPQRSVFSLIGQQVPGVFVTESGILGFGVNTPAGQMSIRGVGGSPNTQVLTLIDGRPQFMGMMGHPVMDSYLSAHIERVEVLRGPASVLYGSNAMGGVINIITRTAPKSGLSGDLLATYGSHDSRHVAVSAGYEAGASSTILSLTSERTAGFRPWSEFNANSGYVKSGYHINDQWSLSVDGSLTSFRTYDPGTVSAPKINNWMEIRRGYVGASIDNDLGISKGALRVAYNFGHHELYTTWNSDDHAAVFSVYQSMTLFPDNTITVGADLNDFGGKAHDKSKNYGSPSVQEYAAYVSMQQIVLQRLVLNGGLRYHHNELFGAEIVPQVGAAFRVTDATALRASAGKGFRSPTIRELYLFPAPTPTLEPERMWNYEAGISQTVFGKAFLDLTAFVSEGSNIILTQGVFPNLKLTNSGTFVHRGVEFSGTALVARDVTVQSSYTYTDPGNETRSVPKHKFFAGIDGSWSNVSGSLSLLHVRGLYGNDKSANKLPDFTTVGLRVFVRTIAGVSLFGSVDNALNTGYQTILGYPMPGRTLSAGVKASL